MQSRDVIGCVCSKSLSEVYYFLQNKIPSNMTESTHSDQEFSSSPSEDDVVSFHPRARYLRTKTMMAMVSRMKKLTKMA